MSFEQTNGTEPVNILLVDDQPSKLLSYEAMLSQLGENLVKANSAKEAGIDGVPCFIFGNVLAVSGAQAPEYLADAIRRASVEYAKRAREPQPASASAD